ncbi:MAG: hypothetical protein H6907_13250 [Hyphomicrobiales bacterium]|nr:hypothetical protein [Hyphomicrobiales bacterium]MCP5372692.1 hypothetical protein [Hyphomicrobiales bacterium]
MAETSHTVRAHLFTHTRTYVLGETALRWRRGESAVGDPEGELAYADVRKLRLYSAPGLGVDVGLCVLRPRRGAGSKVVIKSAHYVSLGNFEDRRASYGPLVRELLVRIAAANPGARMVAGNSALWVTWLVLLALTGLIFLGLAVSLLSGDIMAAGGWGAVAALALMLPLMVRAVRGGRGRPLDPHDPPASLV